MPTSPAQHVAAPASDDTNKAEVEFSNAVLPTKVEGNGENGLDKGNIKLIQDQRQTIALLVSEKAALAGDLERLMGIETGELLRVQLLVVNDRYPQNFK